jgi:hypothetical protein
VEGYRLAHVRQAASEAGIAPEFVELALAEAGGASGEQRRTDSWADRFLGRGPRSLVATRRFDHPAHEVYASMQRVLARYRLSLMDSRGGEPLDGGVLVFELPSVGFESTEAILTDLYTWADVRELHVRLQPLDEGRCEVTLSAPVGYARRLSLGVGGAAAGVVGVVGALAAAALAMPLIVAAGLGVVGEAAALATAAAVGLGVGGGTGVRGMRALYRWGQRRGASALERLLQALGVDLRTGGAFQPPSAAPRLPDGPPHLPPGTPGPPPR